MKAANAQPYLARTADIRRAAERLLRVPEALSKRLNLREVAARVRYRVTGSKFEQTLTLYASGQRTFPATLPRSSCGFAPPAVLKVNLQKRISALLRHAQHSRRRRILFRSVRFAPPRPRHLREGFLDLFKIRRCQIKIRRDPSFPGCIYSEMKMCLAPCFAGCTKEEYDVRSCRACSKHSTPAGESLTDSLEREREAASEALDFERAAALHKRIEKAVCSIARPCPNLRGESTISMP